MSRRARHTPPARPASIAVHNDGNVSRQPSRIERFCEYPILGPGFQNVKQIFHEANFLCYNGTPGYAPSRMYQFKKTSPKNATPNAAAPRKVPNGNSYVEASFPVNQM